MVASSKCLPEQHCWNSLALDKSTDFCKFRLEISTLPAPLPDPDATPLGLLAPMLKLCSSISFSWPLVKASPSTPGIFIKISTDIAFLLFGPHYSFKRHVHGYARRIRRS